ncbi:hypothetical protein [Lutibacter flavus]|uniref:Uncharacterized protein n=1 Tax=Lutibacter flavus TaxID=691689 RepID=A0A238VMS9_9FLAO|nr:hypothetical protein [Lutibacter flavus]SNR35447.1 hypothetical protein SAMN04488111_0719 [Lutibacter flavus]
MFGNGQISNLLFNINLKQEGSVMDAERNNQIPEKCTKNGNTNVYFPSKIFEVTR